MASFRFETFATAIRNHWAIENQNHWVRMSPSPRTPPDQNAVFLIRLNAVSVLRLSVVARAE
jgi:hypothetical protein